MTYPDTSGAERLTKEQLHLLLREVDLEYLVDRPGVLISEINCASQKQLPVGCLKLSRLALLRTGDEELSLGNLPRYRWHLGCIRLTMTAISLLTGEKQRLAIARLLHHRPRFAILDECSSAISSEMERRLYRICREHSITFITIVSAATVGLGW